MAAVARLLTVALAGDRHAPRAHGPAAAAPAGRRPRTSSASPWSPSAASPGPVRGAAAGLRRRAAPRPRAPGRRRSSGLTAVVLVVVGYLAGLLGGDQDRSPLPHRRPRRRCSPAGAVLRPGPGGRHRDRPARHLGPDARPPAHAGGVRRGPGAPSSCPGVAALWRRVDPPPPRYEVGRLAVRRECAPAPHERVAPARSRSSPSVTSGNPPRPPLVHVGSDEHAPPARPEPVLEP